MIFKKILLSLCLFPSLIFGLTFESDKLEDILPYIEEDTWVLIDVDNTLIESTMHLGSAQWRPHLRQKVRDAGWQGSQEEMVIDRFWLFVQPFIPVRPVDPETSFLVSTLQESGVPVYALTARDFVETFHTREQLNSVGIDLSSQMFPEAIFLHASGLSLFDKGVIYSGDNSKFEALNALFEEMGQSPKKVIFVDDKWDQVEKMESKLEKMGIEYVGIRFSRADSRVASFDPMIADFQFSLLPYLISDEEAKDVLNTLKDQ